MFFGKRGFARRRNKLRLGYPGGRRRILVPLEDLYDQELKFFDTNISFGVDEEFSVIIRTFNNIRQGTSGNERIGRSLVIRRFMFEYSILTNDIFGPNRSSAALRVIIYLDTQANGATIVVSDILQTANYHSFTNLENRARFSIIMDRTHVLNALARITDDVIPTIQVHNFYSKELNIPIDFDDSFTDGRMSTIRSNNIGILFISRNGNYDMKGEVRLRFTDS